MKSFKKNRNAAIALSMGEKHGVYLAIGLTVLLLSLSFAKPDVSTSIRTATNDIVTPVLHVFNKPFQHIAQSINSVSGVAALRAENARLQSENMRLKEWYQTALMLEAENKSLQSLLNLKINPTQKYITAKTLSDTSNTFVQTILIKAGVRDNVEKNQVVLGDNGIIGRIVEVGNDVSRVLLLTDVNSRIPVMVEGSKQRAILSGNNGNLLTLKHLSEGQEIPKGTKIVTSGDGGIFPVGLPVGNTLSKKDSQYSVTPYSDMKHLTYVRILDTISDVNLVKKSF